MKTGLQMALAAMLLVGCSAPSKFKNDPRAAVVGPDFLDYIVQYPMDRDTQYYYPSFNLVGGKSLETPSGEGSSSFPANISALMIETPEATPSAVQNAGKGWVELQRDGIPF